MIWLSQTVSLTVFTDIITSASAPRLNPLPEDFVSTNIVTDGFPATVNESRGHHLMLNTGGQAYIKLVFQ